MITYLLPTHDRPQRLRDTLAALGDLSRKAHECVGGGEVVVVDNASNPPVIVPRSLPNGFAVHLVRQDKNVGTAARNVGAATSRGEWIVMLDDDSFPLDCGHLDLLNDVASDVAAIGADISLPSGQRESGGLPEVFIGCGVAIRRDVFVSLGGYDPAFDYYAEEYDLAARMLLDGWRVTHDARFRVRHEKVAAGRDMNRILHRLVRNNSWVSQRYAPEDCREQHVHETISRYAQIAVKEHAACGFATGMADLTQTLNKQIQRPMSTELFDRFTGVAHARIGLREALQPFMKRGCNVCIVDEGKNAWAVRQALGELAHLGIHIVTEDHYADVYVVGTLSPGPMLDALERRQSTDPKPVIAPWLPLALTCDGKLSPLEKPATIRQHARSAH